MKKLSIIVPCYNEGENVALFFDESKKTLDKIKYKKEFIFINDGSKDNTIEELKKLTKKKENIKVINFSRNFGKEAAIYAGLKECIGDLAVLIDADLQQHPKLIIPMLNEIEKDSDLDIVAYYQEKRIENKFIGFCKSLFYKLINKITKLEFKDGASDFRLFKRNVIDTIINFSEHNRFQKGIFAFIGFKTKYLPYIPLERTNGETSWGFLKLVKYALGGIISFTDAPLKLSKYLSIFEILIATIWTIILLVINSNIMYYLFPFLLLLFGLLSTCITAISVYLYRIYNESRRRPIYIIKEIIENE